MGVGARVAGCISKKGLSSRLLSLDLSALGLKAAELAEVCCAIEGCVSLRKLDLSGNESGTIGATSMMRMLVSTGALESIKFNDMEITQHFVRYM